jgi:hypothetical protein
MSIRSSGPNSSGSAGLVLDTNDDSAVHLRQTRIGRPHRTSIGFSKRALVFGVRRRVVEVRAGVS